MKSTLILLIIVTAIESQAQYIANKFEGGLIIGDNLTTYTNTPAASSKHHLSLGIYSRFKLGKRISIDPKILVLNYAGAKGMTLLVPGTNGYTTDVTRTVNYITIVSPFQYHFSHFFSLGIGPQFMITNSSKDEYPSGGQPSIDSRSEVHNYDAGINAGVSFTFGENDLFHLSVLYYDGLMYAFKDDHNLVKNSFFQFQLSVPIIRVQGPQASAMN